ncbi:TPA: hypothetical protein JS389_003678 [Serratia marcescens]|nr:hypothetical protein [Serratia marcescens]
MDSQTTVIDSSEAFWGKVEEYLRRDEENPGQEFGFDMTFAGWPNLHINVKGEKFHSSLTSSMVAGLTSMHESFQRAYAIAKYGTPNLQRLTNEDKQSLDIIFRISEGSTDSDTDWSDTINHAIEFLKGAFEGMTGVQKMTVLIALITALTVGGCFYLYQGAQSEAATTEAAAQNTKTVIDGMNKAYELATQAKQRGETAYSREIEAHGEVGKGSLLKSVANDAEQVKVGHETYTGAQLKDYTGRQSVDRERKESFDNFYIKGIQRAGLTSSELNLTVVRVSNGESFTMKVAEDIARPQELEQLARSIVSGEVVRISYLEVVENGHVARGQFNLILDNQPPQQSQNPS